MEADCKVEMEILVSIGLRVLLKIANRGEDALNVKYFWRGN